MVFFYLVTTGWIFDISLCENSINQSINVIPLEKSFYEGKKTPLQHVLFA